MARLSLASLILGLGLARPSFAGLAEDRAAVLTLKQKITLDPQGITKSWQGSEITENWKGLYLEKDPAGAVALASIDFNGYNLDGSHLSLDGFLDIVTELALFHANSNHFKGTIPDLSKLQWLYEIDVSNNELSGSFPTTVLQPDLTFLDLRFNKFHGPVPAQVWTRYTGIQAIFLNDNGFSGRLPSDIGASPVNYLSLANNKFSGPLPEEIGRMSGLAEFVALNNRFKGTIPDAIGSMGGLSNLTVFDVSHNSLTGSLPESLCSLPKLEILDVRYNELSGHLGPNCKRLLAKGVLKIDGNKISR